MKSYAGKTIWIIGASSGIGESLSKFLANSGAKIILSSRNVPELERVKLSLPGTHTIYPLDVSKAEEVSIIGNKVFSEHDRIDSIIFLAAIYEPSSFETMKTDIVRDTVNVNLTGVFHVIKMVLPYLLRQKSGQIALCGSVAGYCGLPNGQPYSATKAAIINVAQSLRCEMKGKNIDVKLISPGFVRTPLTAKNNFKMPMMIEADKAAEHIASGLLKDGFEIRFPLIFTTLVKLLAALPYALYFRLFR